MTRQEIMKDLREIRYYYSRKKGFDELKNEIESNIIAEKVQHYESTLRLRAYKSRKRLEMDILFY